MHKGRGEPSGELAYRIAGVHNHPDPQSQAEAQDPQPRVPQVLMYFYLQRERVKKGQTTATIYIGLILRNSNILMQCLDN